MTDAEAFDLIHKLTSEDAKIREEAADCVADMAGSMSAACAEALARVLVFARLVETDEPAQEAQLNALVELSSWLDLSANILKQLQSIKPHDTETSQKEYLSALLLG